MKKNNATVVKLKVKQNEGKLEREQSNTRREYSTKKKKTQIDIYRSKSNFWTFFSGIRKYYKKKSAKSVVSLLIKKLPRDWLATIWSTIYVLL